MSISAPMGSINDQPAAHLLGVQLEDGWQVVQKVVPGPNRTGGNFSVGYIAEKIDSDGNLTGQTGFIKAIDFSKWQLSGPDFVTALRAMTEAFIFEREVVEKCSGRRMRNVIHGYGHGVVTVGTGPIAPVNYIIFEVADGDVREHLDGLAAFDEAWALRVLHNVANGLNQLHSAEIFHQDLKPSNVLMFPEATKLGDLGRAHDSEFASPHKDHPAPGDVNYAPPECWYGQVDPDRVYQSRAIDIYHLGSMILFMFTKVSTTAALVTHLDDQFYPHKWAGTFDQVLPYLRVAYDDAMVDLQAQLPPWLRNEFPPWSDSFAIPTLRLRGNPRRPVASKARLSPEHYVSRLDYLARKAEIELRKAMR